MVTYDPEAVPLLANPSHRASLGQLFSQSFLVAEFETLVVLFRHITTPA
jgi:hypothetical protein